MGKDELSINCQDPIWEIPSLEAVEEENEKGESCEKLLELGRNILSRQVQLSPNTYQRLLALYQKKCVSVDGSIVPEEIKTQVNDITRLFAQCYPELFPSLNEFTANNTVIFECADGIMINSRHYIEERLGSHALIENPNFSFTTKTVMHVFMAYLAEENLDLPSTIPYFLEFNSLHLSQWME
ncbi:MAG: hypothetical protein K2X39_06065, partial [Silvanigrellaceae bacterium]|nr:hypothetical protein [Silvanigrellaceae bacterium]